MLLKKLAKNWLFAFFKHSMLPTRVYVLMYEISDRKLRLEMVQHLFFIVRLWKLFFLPLGLLPGCKSVKAESKELDHFYLSQYCLLFVLYSRALNLNQCLSQGNLLYQRNSFQSKKLFVLLLHLCVKSIVAKEKKSELRVCCCCQQLQKRTSSFPFELSGEIRWQKSF